MLQMRPASTGSGFEHSKAITEILKLLTEKRNLDFSGFRPSVVEREVRHRMQICRCEKTAEYKALLENDAGEVDSLLDSLTVGVSEFFRDPLVFSILSKIAIPLILEKKAQKGDFLVRVWSAGCSSGEEAYSIAILIAEALSRRVEPFKFLVFGTDIDEKDLARAREGRYPRDRLSKLPIGFLEKYFHEENGLFRVKKDLRKGTCWFSRHDLLANENVTPAESVYGTFDIILCCNVLMYMLPKIQEKIFACLDKTLKRGGLLVIGEAEEIPAQQAAWYDTVCRHCKVYRKA